MPDEAALQRLLDRQSIIDCLLRYTRGVDRGDWDLMSSAYHEDALDDHGYFVGRGVELAKWSAEFRRLNPSVRVVRHTLTNHTFEFDGPDRAHVETYYAADTVLDGDKPVMRTTLGRYVDRFERRGGDWRSGVQRARLLRAMQGSGEGSGGLLGAYSVALLTGEACHAV